MADSATAVVDSVVADSVVACSASDQTTEQKAKTKLMTVGILTRRCLNSMYHPLEMMLTVVVAVVVMVVVVVVVVVAMARR